MRRRVGSSSTNSTLRRGGEGDAIGGSIYAAPLRVASTDSSARAALQLEQIVELGQNQEEPQLLVGTTQAHREPALRGLALDQHQRAQARAIDLARAREIDDQPP